MSYFISKKNELVIPLDVTVLHLRAPSILNKCEWCGRGDGIYDRYRHWKIGNYFSFMYVEEISAGTYCNVCLYAIDKTFIEDIPVTKLPLYVNQRWLTESGDQAYKLRLSGVES